MNLLLCSYYYPPSVGGVERQSHLLARGLVGRGHRVRVISARLDGMSRTQVLDGVSIERVSPGTGHRFQKMATYLATSSLRALGMRRWPDVIQVQQALYPAAAMVVVARLLGRPLVVRNSGSGRFGAVSVMSALPGGPTALRLIGRGATVVSLGAEMSDELRGVPMRQIREIRNGVEIPEPISEQERTEARARLQVAQDRAVGLYFGRFDEEKGVELALEAAAECSSKGCTLLLVGSGPGEPALRKRAAEIGDQGAQVVFFPPTTVLRPYLAASDVFVLPSYSEGISNSLLEAMAHGLAPLATDVGGNRTVLVSPEVGVLAPREPRAFGQQLARMLSNRAETRALGARARSHVEANFSLCAMLDAYEALYSEVCRSRRGKCQG